MSKKKKMLGLACGDRWREDVFYSDLFGKPSVVPDTVYCHS